VVEQVEPIIEEKQNLLDSIQDQLTQHEIVLYDNQELRNNEAEEEQKLEEGAEIILADLQVNLDAAG
jgi:hypothetical protein